MKTPKLISGGLAVDDRGVTYFVNDFVFGGIKRHYTLHNHTQGFVRAWHGHKMEEKYVNCVKGAVLVCAVEIDNWDSPSKDQPVHRFVLSENRPAVLHIPKGYANGFKSLTVDAILMFFSTSTLEEAQKDDFRFDAYYWNPWDIIER